MSTPAKNVNGNQTKNGFVFLLQYYVFITLSYAVQYSSLSNAQN